MEPVSLIVSALAAGASAALKDTAATAVKEAYDALKSFIASKFKKKASIESLEEKPDSPTKQEAVREDLTDAKATDDVELRRLAKALLDELQKHAPESGPAVGVDLQRVEADFIKLGNVTSTHIGVQMKDVKTTGGISTGNIKAGKDPDRP